MLKVFTLVAAVVAICTSSCLAQSLSDKVSTTEKIAAVQQMMHRGAPTSTVTIGADAASLLGLSKSDVKGLAIASENPKKQICLWFVTFPGRSDVAVVRRDKSLDRTVYWLLKEGAVSATVQRDPKGIRIVSGEVYDKAGIDALDHLYRHTSEY